MHTRNVTDFFREYIIGHAFLAGCTVSAAILLIALPVFEDYVYDPAKREKELYMVFEGKETQNKELMRAAQTFRSIFFQEKEFSEKTKAEIQELVKSRYFGLFTEKYPNLVSLVRGEKSNLSDSVVLQERFIFYVWLLGICLWLISFAAALNFTIASSIGQESIFSWPWRRKWEYLVFLALLPGLAPFMVWEAVRLCIVRIYSRRTQRVQESNPQKTPEIPEDKKASAYTLIEEAKEHLAETEKWWNDFYKKKIHQHRRELQDEIQKARKGLSFLGAEITQAQKNLACAEKEFSQWQEVIEYYRGRRIPDFYDLLNIKGVLAVRAQGDRLRIYTDTIYIDYGSRRYEIGMFEIAISLYESGGYVQIRNLTNAHPQGHHHPYGAHGNFCFGDGELGKTIQEALAKKEIAVAVTHILQAMQSAEGDRSCRVKEWKEVAR